MRITTAMVADAATVADGKLYVHGGGWDSISTTAVPTTHPSMAVALVVEAEWSETHVERDLHVALFDEDDHPLGIGAVGKLSFGHPPGLTHGSPVIQPLAITFAGTNFPRVGRYFFKVTIDEEEFARIRFAVKTLPKMPEVPGAPAVGAP
jgi:hypothetical protein